MDEILNDQSHKKLPVKLPKGQQARQRIETN